MSAMVAANLLNVHRDKEFIFENEKVPSGKPLLRQSALQY
jgi:hypothetical protein